MHEYIRKLIFKDLSKTTTEKVLRQVRKLNWNDEKVSFIECILIPNIFPISFFIANLVSLNYNYRCRITAT